MTTVTSASSLDHPSLHHRNALAIIALAVTLDVDWRCVCLKISSSSSNAHPDKQRAFLFSLGFSTANPSFRARALQVGCASRFVCLLPSKNVQGENHTLAVPEGLELFHYTSITSNLLVEAVPPQSGNVSLLAIHSFPAMFTLGGLCSRELLVAASEERE